MNTYYQFRNEFGDNGKFKEVEKAALRAFGKFPQDALDMVVEVLQLYEKYQTSDVDEKLMKKSSSKLMKGEKLITPMSIFRPLSLMTPEIVRECCPKILTGSMKLEDLISESTQVSKQRTKEGLVMKITGFKSIELLRCQFPNKFTTDILDKLSNTPEPKPNPAGGGRVDASSLKAILKV